MSTITRNSLPTISEVIEVSSFIGQFMFWIETVLEKLLLSLNHFTTFLFTREAPV